MSAPAHTHAPVPRIPAITSATRTGPSRLLQRRCACGEVAGHEEPCEECRAKRLQRKATHAGFSPHVPSAVYDVVGAAGHPLDPTTRSFFEQRFGHDFAAVRVHDDERAARSVREVGAVAYTVGSHLAFDRGQYSTQSPSGLRLLAHELAHVVQQHGGAGAERLQRASISESAIRMGPEDDELERQAEKAADDVVAGGGISTLRAASRMTLQRQPHRRRATEPEPHAPRRRQPAIEGLDEAGPGANLTGETDMQLLACMQGARPDPDECSPGRSLTWADFAGAARGRRFGAETHSTVDDAPMDPVRAGCLQRILGWSRDQSRVFQARLNTRTSWVRPKFKNPTNPVATGCARQAQQCVNFFQRQARRRQGGTFAFEGQPSADCPASAIAGRVVASSRADCADIQTECTRTAVAESSRLLRHEQGHFDISCVIARKANGALAAGASLAAIKRAVRRELGAAQRAYDNDSDHGCIAALQASWEADIAARLPNVSIP